MAAFVVILTASYILWAIQRVYLGAEYKGPHGEDLRPISPREWSIAVPLVVLAIALGVYPQALFRYMSPSVNLEVEQLAKWADENRPPGGEAAAAAAVPAAQTGGRRQGPRRRGRRKLSRSVASCSPLP